MNSPELSEAVRTDGSMAAAHRLTSPAEADSMLPADALPKDLPRIGTPAVIAVAFLLIAMLGGLFMLGYLPHRRVQSELRADAASAADYKPVASVVTPKRQAQASSLLLPADVQPFQQTDIHTRANGYLEKVLVDIGDRVTAGQLLAQIDTPEIDAQLDQARAAIGQAEASLQRARTDFEMDETTLGRYEGFAESGGVTQQQLDEKRTQFSQAKAALAGATASVASAKAEARRLEALQSFENVIAPFAGVITSRNYDVGALLSPASAGSQMALFQIHQTDTLRVFVKVPQGYAAQIRMGEQARLTVRDYPGRGFEGVVARTAGAIDPVTRALRVEVDVANHEGLLMGGMYGQVRLELTEADPPFMVPTAALIYNADGLSLGVVEGGRVRFQKVATGRDLGTEIEIVEGLTGQEQVVTNPGELIRDGTEVRTVQTPAPKDEPRLVKSEANPK